MKLTLIRGWSRKKRIRDLVDEISHHERQMRNALSALIELTESGDELHIECRRVLEALESR